MPAQPNGDEALGVDAEATETDAGPPRTGRGSARDPERRCIATMESKPHGVLVRFALSPDKQVTPDVAGRLPGRGAWVTATREAVELAVKKGAFARAFKRQVVVSPDLAGQTDLLLAKRCIDMLGMARRSGNLIVGFEQVREAVRSARPACLIAASEGSEDQRGKVLGLVRGLYGPDLDNADHASEIPDLPPVAGCFSGDELGMALGRERVIHACLKYGPIAHAWMGELGRLSGFRRVWLPGWEPTSGSGTTARGEI